jgi:hypothetical protein
MYFICQKIKNIAAVGGTNCAKVLAGKPERKRKFGSII